MTFNDDLFSQVHPSIFELIAQENMEDSLKPAMKYTTKVITGLFAYRVSSFIDEVSLVVEGVIQTLFLWKNDSSISENFYDLKRVSCAGGPLNKDHRIKSLICLVLIPYVLSKLDSIHSELLYENDDVVITYERHKVKFLFFKIYPYLLTCWNMIKFIFQLRYLFNYSLYYTPLLWLSGIQLSRNLTDTQRSSSQSFIQSLVSVILPVLLFTLKFIEWWYSPDKEESTRRVTQLPVPPPPPPMKGHSHGIPIPDNPILCPICLHPRRNPTCVTRSGFVYCYVCIYQHVEKNKICPISLLSTDTTQLIRLFTI